MALEVRDVSKTYQVGRSTGANVPAVDDVSLSIEDNAFVTVLGPSGCGKTTLLRMIAGFEQPSQGQILYNGVPVERPDAARGVVFQRPWLYPWLNVRDNIAFGLKLSRRKVDWKRVAEVIDVVGLTGFETRAPHELSGGMQQRAALARSLVMSPKMLLMDEPFGALDAQTRQAMQEFLLHLWDQIKATVVFITHDIEEAILLGDRLVVMSPRPGRIALDRQIDLPRPRDETTVLEPHFIDIRREALETLMTGGSSRSAPT
jgi:NitT/TauT family transport system ATP-binding protein